MESLNDKLKSLGVHLGASNLPKKDPPIENWPIEKVLPGFESETPFGRTFIFERHTEPEDTQGNIRFDHRPDFATLAEWRNSQALAQTPVEKVLYLDTETSGLAGGTGTFAFMIGIGFINNTGFHLYQLFLRHPAEEKALLASLLEMINEFQVVVTFNGASFDLPLLNTRYALHAIPSPFPERLHVDMLPLARRLWKNRLPSRRLGNLEVEILGLGRTEDEVPGWLVPEMYHDYILTKDARPLAGVFYHNEMDIRSLGALFLHCADLLSHPMDYVADEGLDLIAIARLHEELDHYEKAIQLYEAGLASGLPEDFYIQTLLRYAEIYKRRKDFSQACSLWERAANFNSVEACIELAKYHEHLSRSPHQALEWAQSAKRIIISTHSQNRYIAQHLLEPIESRIERLSRKLQDTL